MDAGAWVATVALGYSILTSLAGFFVWRHERNERKADAKTARDAADAAARSASAAEESARAGAELVEIERERDLEAGTAHVFMEQWTWSKGVSENDISAVIGHMVLRNDGPGAARDVHLFVLDERYMMETAWHSGTIRIIEPETYRSVGIRRDLSSGVALPQTRTNRGCVQARVSWTDKRGERRDNEWRNVHAVEGPAD